MTVGVAYLVCLFLLGLVSFLTSLLAGTVPVHYVGLLGLVPISIGAVGIWRLARGPVIEDETGQEKTMNATSVFIVASSAQLGNGADTVLTFGALFADSLRAASYLIMFTMAAMAVLFLGLANYFVKQPVLSELIQRHAHRLTPFVLIFVGLYILANTATDTLPG
jgi:cadmium resistance protein CadD (predicted permease)